MQTTLIVCAMFTAWAFAQTPMPPLEVRGIPLGATLEQLRQKIPLFRCYGATCTFDPADAAAGQCGLVSADPAVLACYADVGSENAFGPAHGAQPRRRNGPSLTLVNMPRPRGAQTDVSSEEKMMPVTNSSTMAAGSKPGTGPDPGLRWHETLRDGTRVLIRPIQKEDAGLERAFIERLSAESRGYRFLGQMKVSDEMLRRLTDINYRRDMAFVALRHEAGQTTEIGVSRYCISDDGSSCECAVAVGDEWQGRGLGYLLMRHLIDVARQRGIKRLFSIDAVGNQRMRSLAEDLGFQRQVDHDFPSQVVHSLAL